MKEIRGCKVSGANISYYLGTCQGGVIFMCPFKIIMQTIIKYNQA